MKSHCDNCHCPIERAPSTCNAKGSKRNFCSRRCMGEYRSNQLGKAAHAFRHGGKGTRIYGLWKNIKTRCFNSSVPHFKYYGGRGILMCDLWARDFEAFRTWSVANGYNDTLQIDRINNDGNYEPKNCRWVTAKENRRNTPSFVRTEGMEIQVLALVRAGCSYPQIARRLSISKSTVFRIASDSRQEVNP